MKEVSEVGQFQMTSEMMEHIAPQIAASVDQNIVSGDSINLYGEDSIDQIMYMMSEMTKKTMALQIPKRLLSPRYF
jgi:hypothetical protein